MKIEEYKQCLDLVNEKIKSLGLDESNIYRTSINLTKLHFPENYISTQETSENSCYSVMIKVFNKNNDTLFCFSVEELFLKEEKIYICRLDTNDLIAISNIDYDALQYFLNRIK